MTDATTTLTFDARGQQVTARQVQEVAGALDRVKVAGREAAFAGDLLVDQFTALRQAHQFGLISLEDYGKATRSLLADLRGFAAQTRLSADANRYFAQQASVMEASLRRVDAAALRTQNAAVRAGAGVQTLAFSMANGRVSAGGLLTALGTLGIGSPAFIAITAGLAGIGTLIAQLGEKTDDTADRFKELLHFVRAVGEASTLLRLNDLRAQVSALRPAQFEDREVGGPTGGRTQRVLVDPDAAERGRLMQEIDDLGRALEIARNDAQRERNARPDRRQPDRGPENRAFILGAGPDIGAIADRQFQGRTFDQRQAGRRDQREADDALLAALMPSPEALAEASRLAGQHVDAITSHLEDLQKQAEATGTALANAFMVATEALLGGGDGIRAVTNVFLGEAQKRLRLRAAEEFAEAVASFANPAAAAKHFLAGTLFAGAAGLAGSIASGGIGGAAGARETLNGSRSLASERGTTIVEIPSDNEILGRRNPAFQDLIRGILEQLGQKNVLIRYT